MESDLASIFYNSRVVVPRQVALSYCGQFYHCVHMHTSRTVQYLYSKSRHRKSKATANIAVGYLLQLPSVTTTFNSRFGHAVCGPSSSLQAVANQSAPKQMIFDSFVATDITSPTSENSLFGDEGFISYCNVHDGCPIMNCFLHFVLPFSSLCSVSFKVVNSRCSLITIVRDILL